MRLSMLLLAFTLCTGFSACTKSDDSKPAVNNNSNGNNKTDTAVKHYTKLEIGHEPGAKNKLESIALYEGVSYDGYIVNGAATFTVWAEQTGKLVEENETPLVQEDEVMDFKATNDDVFIVKNGDSITAWKPASNSFISYWHEQSGITPANAAKELNSLVSSAKTSKFRKL